MDRNGNYRIILNSSTGSISKLIDSNQRREVFLLDNEQNLSELLVQLTAVNTCGDSDPSVLHNINCSSTPTGKNSANLATRCQMFSNFYTEIIPNLLQCRYRG